MKSAGVRLAYVRTYKIEYGVDNRCYLVRTDRPEFRRLLVHGQTLDVVVSSVSAVSSVSRALTEDEDNDGEK